MDDPRAGGWIANPVLFAIVLVTTPVSAQSSSRPFFAPARLAFGSMSPRDRDEASLELMATGDFNAMASSEFSGRIYDATASFQTRQGLEPSGVLTSDTRSALGTVGGHIFNSWGLAFIDHPSANASVVVPGRFGLVRTATARGYAFENRNHTMSVDFSFFPASDTTLDEVFGRLTRPIPGRRIDMQVLRPTFFAVAGGGDATLNYSRYIVIPGGIAGFTMAWNTSAFPNAGRVAVVMANELYPRHMVGENGQSASPFDAMPGDLAPLNDASANTTPLNSGMDSLSQQAIQASEAAKQRADAMRAQQQALAQQAALERARVARQQDDDRRARIATAQAARDAAAAQLKAAQREAAVNVAETRLTEATDFVKANRDDPQLVDHLQHIADLNTALAGADPNTIERKTGALTAALATDPIYTAYAAQRDAERQRENERSLRDTIAALIVQKTFLIGAVTQDPMSTEAATFLTLAKQADAALTRRNLEQAQTLMGTIDGAIDKAGLSASYAVAKGKADQPNRR